MLLFSLYLVYIDFLHTQDTQKMVVLSIGQILYVATHEKEGSC
jgi:hypothetical protein